MAEPNRLELVGPIAPDWTIAVKETILEHTENGVSLSRICEMEGMPSRRTVYNWIEQDEDFGSQFRARRILGIHYLAEECIGISDEPARDAMDVARNRLRIDTRLRLAGKWLPKAYGDKVQVDVSEGPAEMGRDDVPPALSFLRKALGKDEGNG